MTRKQKIFIYGSTFRQATSGNAMELTRDLTLKEKISHFISSRNLSSDYDLTNWEVGFIDTRTGSELTFQIIKEMIEHISNLDDVILIAGTDSLEELAFALSLIDLDLTNKNIFISGAIYTSDHLIFDGINNIARALIYCENKNNHKDTGAFYTDTSKQNGVLVCMNDEILDAHSITKAFTNRIHAFQTRENQPRLKKDDKYPATILENQTIPNIPIIINSINLSPNFLNLEQIDGLVIGGMGTSTINKEWIDYFSSYTDTMPIALVSRIPFGDNYDELCYVGSLKKYEDLGFLLSPYRHYNMVQTRIKMAFDILYKKGN